MHTDHHQMHDGFMTQLNAGGEPRSIAAHVLLIEPVAAIAECMVQELKQAMPNVLATRCDSIVEAEAYLASTSFDAVCTADVLPDGTGLDVLKVRNRLGLAVPVVIRTSLNGAYHRQAQRAGAAACFTLGGDETGVSAVLGRVLRRGASSLESVGDDQGALTEDQAALLLEALRAETGAVTHAINNPLTVITGNVQFLQEVAMSTGVDPLLAGPIDDIGTAARQLSEALVQLSSLRQRIAVALGTGDRL